MTSAVAITEQAAGGGVGRGCSIERVSLIAGRELSGALRARWDCVQQATPYLDSPYFCSGFVEAVAAVRPSVEIAVLEDGAAVAGFFPFERGRARVAGPVGGRLSDFQGVVAPAGTSVDVPALLHGCALESWRFDHLVTAQEEFRPYHWLEAPSPFVDLSRGIDGWRAARRAQGSREVDQILYKARRAQRRLGPVRFELHTADARAFPALLAWKGRQLRASGSADQFAIRWVVELLERIRAARSSGFSGVLSALHLGDRLAAVHFGMRSGNVLHWWLPAYDPDLAAHSPGQICFLELARAAAEDGVHRIDLGKGDEPYKYRMMSGAKQVAEGALSLSPGMAPLCRHVRRALETARRSRLLRPLVRRVRLVKRML